MKKIFWIVVAAILSNCFTGPHLVADQPFPDKPHLEVTYYGTRGSSSVTKPASPTRKPVTFAGMSSDDFHEKTSLYVRMRRILGGENSAGWKKFMLSDEYKQYQAAARVYLGPRKPASSETGTAVAKMGASRRDTRVLITPGGSVFNSRTFSYDQDRGVQLRPEFEGMDQAQRIVSVQGDPETKGKVYYRGNPELGLGPGRWVMPNQLAQLYERELTIFKGKNARLRTMASSSASQKPANSPSTSSVYRASPVSEKLTRLIHGATVHIRLPDGLGSGVITTIKGRKYILTANHVIKGAPWALVTSLKDGSSGQVNRTGGWHEGFDVAAIALPAAMKHLPAVLLYRGQLPVGHPVYLSGFPGGYYHLTSGAITGYTNADTEMLHSARSAGGASGGMLITAKGYLCGIHTGIYLPASPFYPNAIATPSSVIHRLVDRYGR
jgi:S1-C subfamily serine protease